MKRGVVVPDPEFVHVNPTLIVASGSSANSDESRAMIERAKSLVVAVKDGYKLVANCSAVLMIGDHRYAKRQPDFLDFNGHQIIYSDPDPLPECWSHDQRIEFIPKVAGAGISTNPHELRGTFTTTALAINYAVLRGAKRIVLIGVDGKPASDGSRWFGRPDKENWTHRYTKQKWGYERMNRHLHEHGVTVYNANRNSAIRTFKIMPRDFI